jgi:hypothetical protein
MNKIRQNIEQIRKTIPSHVKLIAVSKTKPVSAVLEAMNTGQNAFGENKVQELVTKATEINRTLEWHMIGHLQTNKVKQLLPHVYLIHSVESLKLAQEINKEASKIGKIIPCLLQIHIAKEETKFGFSAEELQAMLQMPDFRSLKNIEIHGLMGMATFTDDMNTVRKEFASLRKLFDTIKTDFFNNQPFFKELSMGMSDDYRIAIDEGSTMVRIGSLIFGERTKIQK